MKLTIATGMNSPCFLHNESNNRVITRFTARGNETQLTDIKLELQYIRVLKVKSQGKRQDAHKTD